jgi:predicted DNA-binding protein YlxM (UPF0122 family)
MKIDEGRCVYILYNPITQLTKIGMSDNIDARKSSLESACGCPLELIHKTKHLLCGEKYELDAHRMLKEYRKLGEWFSLPNHQIGIDVVNLVIKDATEDVIVENYKKGVSITKIAEDYEVTRQAILARLKKYGVYDNKGRIFEREPSTVKPIVQPIKVKERVNVAQHISTVDEAYDDLTYLDGEIPNLPLKNLKRAEPNLNYNGEWYQISLFKEGSFIYAYTKDLIKARAYLQGVKTVDYTKTLTK